jgi:hypothetical protein
MLHAQAILVVTMVVTVAMMVVMMVAAGVRVVVSVVRNVLANVVQVASDQMLLIALLYLLPPAKQVQTVVNFLAIPVVTSLLVLLIARRSPV